MSKPFSATFERIEHPNYRLVRLTNVACLSYGALTKQVGDRVSFEELNRICADLNTHFEITVQQNSEKI